MILTGQSCRQSRAKNGAGVRDRTEDLLITSAKQGASHALQINKIIDIRLWQVRQSAPFPPPPDKATGKAGRAA